MGEPSRYSVTDGRAGIENGVLKNKLHIKDQKKLEDLETLLLSDTYSHFLTLIEKRTVTFDFAFLCSVHKFFLGTLYLWVGKIRSVDISKNDVLFAPIKFIDQSLKTFQIVLHNNRLVPTDNKRHVALKLAIIHNEFNSLHPFREGNGRTIRLFLDLMVVSNGYNLIDWSRRSHMTYLRACVKGLSAEHSAMTRIILAGLTKKN
ncbi:Fic family protein [Candidatus Uhrbacteria bacterium]|nr:Fic family protein [Candidatus Uhrbacteria bacterium]